MRLVVEHWAKQRNIDFDVLSRYSSQHKRTFWHLKVEKMNSTPECVTKHLKLKLAKTCRYFSDAEQRSDNSKVSSELGKTSD